MGTHRHNYHLLKIDLTYRLCARRFLKIAEAYNKISMLKQNIAKKIFIVFTDFFV
jgi:hypothetical protein